MVRLSRLLWMLVLTTLFIWGFRINNIIGDGSLDGWYKLWRVVVAVIFLTLAGTVGVALTGRWSKQRIGSTRLVAIFCLWTTVFWSVRSTGILLGDYDASFMLVHTALAVISISIAWPVYRLDRSLAGKRDLVEVPERSLITKHLASSAD